MVKAWHPSEEPKGTQSSWHGAGALIQEFCVRTSTTLQVCTVFYSINLI